MLEEVQQFGAPKCGLSANALKTIAIVAMVIDHIASGFLEYNTLLCSLMNMIGRITGPTMFYFVAVGYRHTSNIRRYTLRLALFAAVSYVPYIYFNYGTWPNEHNMLSMSVIFTILAGLLGIRVMHEVRKPALRYALLVLLFLLSAMGDWGPEGYVMMLSFDFFYGDKAKQTFGYLLIVTFANGLMNPLLMPWYGFLYGRTWDFSMYPWLLTRIGLLFPILLLQLYNGEKGGGGGLAKWGFYLFYPLHFVVLGLIRALMYA